MAGLNVYALRVETLGDNPMLGVDAGVVRVSTALAWQVEGEWRDCDGDAIQGYIIEVVPATDEQAALFIDCVREAEAEWNDIATAGGLL